MNDSSPVTLYYVHDPMCSWCWGFRKVWNEVRQRLPDDVKLVTRVGGLAADSDQPMAQGMRDNLQATWKRISEVIPGTEFNFDFWTSNTPRRSTYPACRAAIAARLMEDKEAEMTLAIQQAYYLQARNPSDLVTLIDAAARIGLDTDKFEQLMTSDELNNAFAQELQQVRSIGVNSFPSLILASANSLFNIPVNYNSADAIMNDIQSLIANRKKDQ